MKPASEPRAAPRLRPSLPAAHLPGGGLHASATQPPPGFFSDFIPIAEVVARVVGRVMRRQREREAMAWDEAELVARFPVCDPEDEAVAREFAEPTE